MLRFVLRVAMLAGGLLIVALMLMVAGEVLARSLFGHSFLLADEYSGYIVVMLVFLGIPYALHEEALLRVDFLFERLRGRGREVLGLLFDLISLLVTLVLGFYLTRMVVTTFERGTFSSTPQMTPLWIPQVAMPLGILLLVVVLLARIAGRLRALRRGGQALAPGPDAGRGEGSR